MPINNSTNFTTIAADSGSATMATGTNTGFTIAGTGGVSTSATGSTITVSGASIPPTPSSVMTLYEEFIGWNTLTNSSTPGNIFIGSGNYLWMTDSTTGWQGSTIGSSGNPGIISNVAIASWINIALVNSTAAALFPQMLLGGGAISLNWIIKIATLSVANPRYILRVGLGDTFNATTDQANGVYFEYSDNVNSVNYTIKTAAATVRTTANTSTAATTNFVNLGITVNAAATSVAYFVNGVQVSNSPISTNIPTAPITPFVQIAVSVGTIAAASILLDAMYLTQTFTTPR